LYTTAAAADAADGQQKIKITKQKYEKYE